jgi:energy-coupling factor transport system substrate-specific component
MTLIIALYSLVVLSISYFEILPFLDPLNGIFPIIFHIIIYFLLLSLGLYYRFEEHALSTKELTFIAIYSSFTAIARIPFLALPSIQPCTYLIFCAGLVFGPLIGFMVGANTAILSNFIAGHGPWTLFQIIAWGLVGIIGGCFQFTAKKSKNRSTAIILALVGFVLGLLYGMIMNIWSWIILEPPYTWEKFVFILSGSILFDIAHGFGNFVFLYAFGHETIQILLRYKIRFLVHIIPDETVT